MPNLVDIIEVAQELEEKPVVAVPDRCVVVRNRNSSCTKCIDACIADCITAKGNRLEVDYERCVGCGACTTACPVEALVSVRPLDDELEAELEAALVGLVEQRREKAETERPRKRHGLFGRKRSKASDDAPAAGDASAADAAPANPLADRAALSEVPAIIACARIASHKVGDPRLFAEVPCLARVEESLLVDVASRGVRDIVLVDGTCHTCKYRATSERVDEVVRTANDLIAAQGGEGRVRRASEFPACARLDNAEGLLGSSRRSFFGGATQWTMGAAGKAADYMIKKNLGSANPVAKTLRERLGTGGGDTLPQFEARRHTRTLDAMYEIGPSVEPTIDTRLFGRVEIDEEKCNACGMCAVFCPTGALKKSAVKCEPNDEGKPQDGSYLEFSACDCVQCALCADACMKQCLVVNPTVPTSELFDFEPRFIHLPKPGPRPGILSSLKR